jgi:hypothetical protein
MAAAFVSQVELPPESGRGHMPREVAAAAAAAPSSAAEALGLGTVPRSGLRDGEGAAATAAAGLITKPEQPSPPAAKPAAMTRSSAEERGGRRGGGGGGGGGGGAAAGEEEEEEPTLAQLRAQLIAARATQLERQSLELEVAHMLEMVEGVQLQPSAVLQVLCTVEEGETTLLLTSSSDQQQRGGASGRAILQRHR